MRENDLSHQLRFMAAINLGVILLPADLFHDELRYSAFDR
jgi:hypothetical protein